MEIETDEIVSFQDSGFWIGWMKEYPDYWTQGESLEEIKENLKDIYDEVKSGRITPHP